MPKKGELNVMPIKRLCAKCWKPLRPEENQCSNCGSFCIAEPLPIKVNENGTFIAKIKIKSRSKISNHGKDAIEHLRIDVPHHRKIHTVVEKDSEGNWQLVHDENVIQQKRKKRVKENHDK